MVGPVCMPVWPGVKPTAQKNNLASLLLQVHVYELHCFQQLDIQKGCGKVVELILLCVAWKGWLDLLAQEAFVASPGCQFQNELSSVARCAFGADGHA